MTDKIMVKKISLKVNKFFLLTALLLCCSCDGVLFYDFCTVDTDGWHRNDVLEYVYEKDFVKDTTVHFSVDTRTVASYPYKDIVVSVEALDTMGTVFYKDTLTCAVYDDNGRRVGHTVGLMYQQSSESIEILLPHNRTILHVTHLMSDSTLHGVSDIGIRICRKN